jgi:hypothetical protein
LKKIEVQEIEINSKSPDLKDASIELDNRKEEHFIDEVNWVDFSYKPSVRFKIAYGKNEIFLKYYVEEECIRAETVLDNEMICEDSCVELFVSPEPDGIYYNFEFNCIGTCLGGVGTSREDNSIIDSKIVDTIRRLSTLGNKPFKEKVGNFKWELMTAIPVESFVKHEIKELKGRSFRANFYKCGDKLSKVHYLTWSRINTRKPDFHRPEFFGELQFR